MSEALTKKRHKDIRVKRKPSPYSVLVCIVLAVYAVSLLSTLIWGLMSSFKTADDFLDHKLALPETWQFMNYADAFTKFKILVESGAGQRSVALYEMFFYSVLYAGGCALMATLTPCVAGYLTAKFNYFFSKIITWVVIITMILPIVGSLPSEIRMANTFGLYDNIWGLWIMKANFLGIYFLVFQNVFKGVPYEFTEAAKIDGAGNLRIFTSIMLPLAKNAFFTILLLKFIEYWNDYQTPMIYLPNFPTAAVGMFRFSQSSDNTISSVPMKLAGAMLLLLPVLSIFLVFQKRIMGNVSMGGIKG